MLVAYGCNRNRIDVSEGFQIVSAKQMANDHDEEVTCPGCGVEINGPESVTQTGDAIYCKCGELLLEKSTMDYTPTTDEDINREEWIEAFGEIYDPEDGSQDYE